MRATKWSRAIDGERRDAIRRNHTATHVLHWALREVLGPHVKQAGSLVAPDRLRFDFSHFEAVTPEQLDRVEELANREIITDAPVRHYETTKDHAESLGAIAFFGDKYGDLVRVLEAGEHSIELCGGTHVHALGFIGPIKIVSEGSIGANLRRIEAVTGDAALARIHDEEMVLRDAAGRLQVTPAELPERVDKLLDEVKALRQQLSAQQAKETAGRGRRARRDRRRRRRGDATRPRQRRAGPPRQGDPGRAGLRCGHPRRPGPARAGEGGDRRRRQRGPQRAGDRREPHRGTRGQGARRRDGQERRERRRGWQERRPGRSRAGARRAPRP